MKGIFFSSEKSDDIEEEEEEKEEEEEEEEEGLTCRTPKVMATPATTARLLEKNPSS